MHRAVSTSDTIAAIATAAGEAAIAVVRVSGSGATAVADRVFSCSGRPLSERAPFTFVHGRVHSSGAAIDDAIALVWRAPRSYTGEDVVEIQCHGGRNLTGRILRAVLDAGARAAEAGEFTKRAFLNGRIDLVQAEAVLDLIRAVSDRAASAALEQLDGSLSSVITNTYQIILNVASELEAALDFPDDEVQVRVGDETALRLHESSVPIRDLVATWSEGHILRDGAVVVIAGAPNVGKSTLMNAMLGRPRAIVTAVPGTTRDLLEENMIVDGILVRLVDTAGLRAADCEVEREGVSRARSVMARADLCLHVMDASVSPSAEELSRVSTMDPAKTLVILNKADLGIVASADQFVGHDVVTCSLLKEQASAIDAITNRISEKVAPWRWTHAHAVISERHRQVLRSALQRMCEAEELLLTGIESNIVLAASTLRSAAAALGELTGRTYSLDLLDRIFGRFCIGK